MKNNLLSIKEINKSFINKKENIKVLDNISFSVKKGEFLSIVGSSGCGKSTLLNIISNLDKNYNGKIEYFFNKTNIAYMLQDPALFPWLNNITNAKLGCTIKRINNEEYVENLIKRYELDDFKYKYPKDLSGGMKQRISLIRTIATKPTLLLLDEPFAALDYQSRLLISNDVYNLAKENNITVIMITHDISEAISMSDRVIVLSKRPSHIKNIYNINLYDKKNPIDNRKDKYFMKYYELISRDLDIFET